jgi:glycosyltransferase involved in cell wall biosynthesis
MVVYIKPFVSVVIPAYNEEKTVEQCLKSVFKQDEFKKFIGEIIVIDDGSTDDTPRILEKFKGKIKLIRNKRNLGLAKSLNIGINHSHCKFICTLHADCILPRNWFKNQMKFFDDESVAVVTSRIILPRNVWKKFNFWNKIFFSKFLKPRKIICENKCDIYRKDVLMKVGWFSPEFRVAGEDFDLYFRLKKNGFKVYTSDLVVKHIMSSHQRGFWKYFKKELQYGEARGAIFRKHKFLIPFNPFAFRIFNDIRLVFALPLVIILRTFVHFIGFWKGFLTRKQEW